MLGNSHSVSRLLSYSAERSGSPAELFDDFSNGSSHPHAGFTQLQAEAVSSRRKRGEGGAGKK